MNRNILLLFILGLFLGHQVLQKIFALNFWLADSFLDPILGMTLLLFAWHKEQKFLFGKDSLTLFDIVLLTVFVGLFFEFLLPKWHTGFTKDPFDLIFYAFGALLFLLFLNGPANKLLSKADA